MTDCPRRVTSEASASGASKYFYLTFNRSAFFKCPGQTRNGDPSANFFFLLPFNTPFSSCSSTMQVSSQETRFFFTTCNLLKPRIPSSMETIETGNVLSCRHRSTCKYVKIVDYISVLFDGAAMLNEITFDRFHVRCARDGSSARMFLESRPQ